MSSRLHPQRPRLSSPPTRLSPLESALVHLLQPKDFNSTGIRTYKLKFRRLKMRDLKSRRIRTYAIYRRKSFVFRTYEKTGGRGPSWPIPTLEISSPSIAFVFWRMQTPPENEKRKGTSISLSFTHLRTLWKTTEVDIQKREFPARHRVVNRRRQGNSRNAACLRPVQQSTRYIVIPLINLGKKSVDFCGITSPEVAI